MSDPQTSDQHPVDTKSKGAGAAFWTTLPGILTGLAAVITAVVGLFTVLQMGGVGDNENRVAVIASGEPVASQRSGPAEPTDRRSPIPVPTVEPGGATSPGVAVAGQVTMRSPDDADLEVQRVGPGIAGGDLYLYCSANQCLLSATGSGGLITLVEGPMDQAGCLAALQARQDGVLHSPDLAAGTWFCLQTDEARIAAVEVVSAPGVGTAELVLSYTLWR